MFYIFYKVPKSAYRRFYRLASVFGVFQAAKAFLILLSNPFSPSSVIVSCYSDELKKYIYLRPASSDMFVLNQVFIEKQFDYNIDFTPDLFIDGGAHCGFVSLYFHSKFPNMDVIAVEPQKSNYSILKKNLDGLENTELINKPISGVSEMVRLTNPSSDSPGYQFRKSDSGKQEGEVRSITVSEILDQQNESFENGILKLDIEGAEKSVFSVNPEDWIHEFKLIFIEPHDSINPGTEDLIKSVAAEQNMEVDYSGENIVIKNNQG